MLESEAIRIENEPTDEPDVEEMSEESMWDDEDEESEDDDQKV